VKYRREVDGLRAIAIVPVLFFHAGFEWWSGGYVGVDVFFVISGYLITSLIFAERKAGRFSIVSFYERRARRILPALFVVMLACVPPALIWMTPERLENFGQSLVAVSLFANNILLSITSGYFDLAADEKPLLHTWSLAVEEQYYVVFPVLLTACWSLGRRWLVSLIGAIALLSLGLSEWGWRNDPEANFYLVQYRAWELLLGVLVAFAHDSGWQTDLVRPGVRESLAFIGISLVVASVFLFDSQTPFPSLYGLVPTLGTALVLLAADERTWVARALSTRPFVAIGLISYSLYLWHQPLLAFARIMSDGVPPKSLMLSLLLVAAVLAVLSWKFVEMPWRNRKFMTRRAVFGIAASVSTVCIAMGLVGHLTHGLANRMPTGYMTELNYFQSEVKEREKWLRTNCFLPPQIIALAPASLGKLNCHHIDGGDARVLVLGDSHAGDKAMALRLNGVPADEMTGADCSLAPSRMTKRCRKAFDAVLDNHVLSHYDVVLLANRWSDEQEVEAFDREAEYWIRDAKKTVLFGPMPEFGKFADRMSDLVGQGLSRSQAAASVTPDLALLERTDAPLKSAAKHHNFVYFDTAAVFCAASGKRGCVPESDGEYLIIDYAHLSEAGARILGQEIIRQLQLR
jgi:peptidoglycan/LPS O-acetylase OafA/YrhL